MIYHKTSFTYNLPCFAYAMDFLHYQWKQLQHHITMERMWYIDNLDKHYVPFSTNSTKLPSQINITAL